MLFSYLGAFKYFMSSGPMVQEGYDKVRMFCVFVSHQVDLEMDIVGAVQGGTFQATQIQKVVSRREQP
jgi:hypothetical protein